MVRFRLMATYRGVPYEAGIGPSAGDVVLFAACPPPEELGFEPATGHWRKHVIRAEVDALWESRPVGAFRGEPCIVLDDLTDRLHIAFLGTDTDRATQLGYWQIDRGVFELLAPREEVTGLSEERVDIPFAWSAPSAGTEAADPPRPYGAPPQPVLEPSQPLPGDDRDGGVPVIAADRAPAMDITPAPDPGSRAARRQRVPTRDIFCELADLAAIPRAAYALETEVEGAMCVLATEHGFDVFLAVDGARHEVRSFADEEAAYFYLFGVLMAEAIRSGSVVATPAPAAFGQQG